MNRLRRYLNESWSELKKVTWPNRLQVRNLTVLVFVVAFLVGLYITFFDAVFSQAVAFLAEITA